MVSIKLALRISGELQDGTGLKLEMRLEIDTAVVPELFKILTF